MLRYLRAFGCKLFILNKGKDDLGKFDPRSDEGVFVGYSSTSKTYIVSTRELNVLKKVFMLCLMKMEIWKVLHQMIKMS